MPGILHRIHFFTGSGALCGTLAVINWTQVRGAVTCPQCRRLLATAEARAGGAEAARDHEKPPSDW